MTKDRRLIVGITGSSGVILGIRLLQALQDSQVETHLVVSPAARLTIQQETRWKIDDVLALADVNYNYRDLGARIASGSFTTQGMVVIPCSIKTLSAVANSLAGDLLTRAADVTLKEGRPLLLVVREAPFHRGHIRLMDLAAAAGAVIFPPVPAFYTHPNSVDALINNMVGRVLARLGIENSLYQQWQGITPAGGPAESGSINSLPARIPAELLSLPVISLATVGADGAPHAASVYFVADAENGAHPLYFFSSLDSQHGRDLAANPAAALTLSPLVEGWRDIYGLQMRGEAQPVSAGPQWEHAFQLYLDRFPFAANLKQELARNTLYVFTPRWLRLVDNWRGFGFKEEWTQA
jgi:4-hydroxy-3-polyprenylbenzoate decarboxylase